MINKNIDSVTARRPRPHLHAAAKTSAGSPLYEELSNLSLITCNTPQPLNQLARAVIVRALLGDHQRPIGSLCC